MKKEDQEFVELVENFSNGLDQFHRANPITPESKVGCFLLATYEDTMQTAVCCTGDQLYIMLRKYLTKSPKSLEVVKQVVKDVLIGQIFDGLVDPDCEA